VNAEIAEQHAAASCCSFGRRESSELPALVVVKAEALGIE
jgi:hypothetical protein